MGAAASQIKEARRKRAWERRMQEKELAMKLVAQRGALVDGGTSSSIACIDNPGKIEDFYYLESSKIGEGSYARVVKCINKSTGASRACKVIRKNHSGSKELQRARKEILICRQLDHPNIAKLFEHFESDKFLYMVSVLCSGGELLDRLVETGHFTEAQTAILMQQLFRAVFYMHMLQVAHRDLKIENLCLLNKLPVEQNTLKVIDFGCATTFKEGEYLETKCGAPYYVAPQILVGKYTQAVDLWTAGVIMYILLCGYPPFFGESDAEILSKVRIGIFYFSAADWKHVSQAAKELIKSLLKLNPADRVNAKQALHHEWVGAKAPRMRAPVKLKYLDNMRQFGTFNLLKKASLKIMAAQLDEEYTKPLVDTFMWLDGSGEGTISAAEVREGLVKSGHDERVIPEDLDAVVRHIDADGSGELEISEFVASTLDPRIYTREEFCWAAFRIFDQNCDGLIGVRELRDLLNNGQEEEKVSKEQCKNLIQILDEDNDGHLDFNEFMHMMRGMTQKKKSDEEIKKEAYEKKMEKAKGIARLAELHNLDATELAAANNAFSDDVIDSNKIQLDDGQEVEIDLRNEDAEAPNAHAGSVSASSKAKPKKGSGTASGTSLTDSRSTTLDANAARAAQRHPQGSPQGRRAH
eukprot:CAMPEP_0170238700 /NCGR_PEP_ID=MMETSP0116_2-20130129/19106_1 /TAXON_ID=400756 /ORGANISM="Durinskia baltica, Strain CSIRO CS-38" /LENGTH=638 /DNA_ID=CAMNT_0010489515 /DNA_START=94 /DNA_END=2008 /DNA_ORIENTATION=+